MNIHLALPFIIGAIVFFTIMFPMFCYLKTLITVGYMNIANNFKFVFKTMLGTNAISCIFSVISIILANLILVRISIEIPQHYSILTILPYYRAVVVVCMYLLTVLLEWVCMKKMLARLKLNPKKLLTSSFINNVTTYTIAVPIYFLFFTY